uniref:Uncharacterized protein n=3 Tax=Sar TaxID=2698737 RepID=A0A7S0ALN2_9STRA|mmetsp:Transcript_17014/g.28337  ORF Transcript_17014/g.28337 Transcript_17014/m.28337 type:complete len:297 (+) Transcript_17014:153-1043(+)
MVVKNDNASPAYINVSSSTKVSNTSVESSAEQIRAKQITEYLATLDGSPDAFEKYEVQAYRLLHPDLVVESEGGKEIRLDAFITLVRENYIANGCIAEVQAIQHNQDDTITVTIKNYLPGEEGDVTRQLIHFADDGRIVRVEGEDTSNKHKFGSMLDRVAALPTEVEVVAKKYKDFLEYVKKDPPTDSSRLQSIIGDLYDSNAIIVADGRNENLDYFKFTIGEVVAAGSYTRDVKVKVIGQNTIYIDFCVDGPFFEKSIPVRRVVTERNGKVVYSRVAENSEDSFPVYAKRIIGKK